MASVYDYSFDNSGRIGNDICGVSERDMQNNKFGTYATKNYFEKFCGMNKPIKFATTQPNVFYKGGHGGVGGCTVESESDLLIGSTQTNPKCRISLQERPYKTIPFIGRGPSRPMLESRLQQGEFLTDKKSCKNVMEKSFGAMDVDLVPTLKESIQNPANLIEGVAAEGWVRGGLPSREMTRDNDYFERRNKLKKQM